MRRDRQFWNRSSRAYRHVPSRAPSRYRTRQTGLLAKRRDALPGLSPRGSDQTRFCGSDRPAWKPRRTPCGIPTARIRLRTTAYPLARTRRSRTRYEKSRKYASPAHRGINRRPVVAPIPPPTGQRIVPVPSGSRPKSVRPARSAPDAAAECARKRP